MVFLCNRCCRTVTSQWCGDGAFRIYLIAFSLTILDGFLTVDKAVWSVLQIHWGGIDHKLSCRSEILLKKLSIRVRVLLKLVNRVGLVASGFLIDSSLLCFFIYTFIHSSSSILSIPFVWARGSIVGWGTMLQTGRSRVQVPMRWIF
jgi:hypothetical protein